MTAAILAPGPSLPVIRPKADIVVGVNRSCLLHACDVFAALDYPMIRDNATAVLGNPTLLSRKQTVDDLGPQRLERFSEVRLIEDVLAEFCPPGVGVQEDFPNTATSALIYAVWRGAKHVAVYGADWEGQADYDGKLAGEDRTDERWKKERYLWENILMPWLGWLKEPVKVERVVAKQEKARRVQA